METIIEILKNNKLDEFKQHIKNITEYDDLLRIYTFCLVSVITGDIDEPNFVKTMDTMIEYGLDLSQLKSLKTSIELMKQKEMTLCYKFLVMAYIKSFLSGQNTELEKLNITVNSLKEQTQYVNSFSRSMRKLKISSDETMSQSEGTVMNRKYSNEHIENLWEEFTRYELMDRLLLITDKFNYDVLTKAGVKLITIYEAEKMSYNKLANYYNYVVDSLKLFLNKVSKIYMLNNNVNKVYLSLVEKMDPQISIDNYLRLYDRKSDIDIDSDSDLDEDSGSDEECFEL